MIIVRKLVALDIALHGSRIILAEFGIGAPAIIAFGPWLLGARVSILLGTYLLLIGVKYVPLLVYAVPISRGRTANIELASDLANDRHYIRRYGTQQLLILVPLAILFLAAFQEVGRRREIPKVG